MRYLFGDCDLEPQRYELRRHGQVRPIEPQVFDVLILLIRERHRVVTKQELLDTVWGHRFVGESALTSRIKSLRQAVGDDGTAQGIVRTVRRRGYQFVAHVIERADPSTPPRPRPARCRHTTPADAALASGCARASRRPDRTSSLWTFRAAPKRFKPVPPPLTGIPSDL
jgi:DNA-binding winged helix-turn-helix (wHTH) protein